MKVSPLAQASGQPGQVLGNVEVGRTTNPIKLERARAIARGQAPREEIQQEDQQAVKPNVRSIRMRTNRNTTSLADLPQEQLETAIEPESSTSAIVEPATIEDTKPLSPQFAALAKQKRALQLERAELDKQKAELAANSSKMGDAELIAKLKSNPLSVLQEHGVTYEQLTNAVIENGAYSPEILDLKAEMQALKDGMDKKLVDRDTQAEQAALSEMRREAEKLAKEGESFELVRTTGSIPQVIDLIHRTYKQTGEILDVQDALQLVEDELIADSLKLASLKKVQSKIAPPSPPPLQPQQQRQMRTLTARDTAAPVMDRKARALAAALGTLRK